MVSFAEWLERSHGGGRKCPAIDKPGLKKAHDEDPESFMANVTMEGSTLAVQMSVWTMVAGAISAGLKKASAKEPTDLKAELAMDAAGHGSRLGLGPRHRGGGTRGSPPIGA
eukprot:1694518-Prymnesium_polylepis.1